MAVIAVALISLALVIASSSPVSQDVTGQTPDQQGTQLAGVRFEKAINLTNNTQDSVYGQVVARSNSVYVVWQDSVPSGNLLGGQYSSRNYDIFVTASADNGTTFGLPINVSNNPGFSEHPQAASDDDSLYLVWADN
jgi:hypothetical protein